LAPQIINHLPRQGRKFIDLLAGRANVAFYAMIHCQYEEFILNDIRTHQFLTLLKEHGGNIAIEHHTELLARHQDRLPLDLEDQKSAQKTMVFHDACYLGRYRGVYDEPREVLARFGQVVDPPRARERGFCCGGGGGLMFLGEESGKRVNLERAQELVATGASVVAAACPFCNSMLRDGLAAATDTPPELLDVAQIAAAAIAKNNPQKTAGGD